MTPTPFFKHLLLLPDRGKKRVFDRLLSLLVCNALFFSEVEEEQHAKYEVEYCGNRTSNQRKYFLVDADHGSWEKHGFCQVFSPMTVSGQNYKVSGHLYNVIGPQGFDSGFLGLAYNIEDKHNFDFVYFR